MKEHNHEVNIERMTEVVSGAMKQIAEIITEVFGMIKDAIGKLENRTYERKESWATVYDTRRASQVICNKPRNLVKKIIG